MSRRDTGDRPFPDLEPLVAPIAGDHPCGEWLRYDVLFDEIAAARREDDPTLPQGVWVAELKRADWHRVEELCVEALSTRTKDLQAAAWLLEAWLHLHGLSGVEPGLRLLSSLCGEYWECLFPALEPDSTDARVAPFDWLNDRLTRQVTMVPVTAPRTEDAELYSWGDREHARYLANLERSTASEGAQDSAAGGEEGVTLSQFQASVSLTPRGFYERLAESLGGAIGALGEIDEILDDRCGPDAPSLARLREQMSSIFDFAAKILRERPEEEPAAEVAPDAESDREPGGETDHGTEPGVKDQDEVPMAGTAIRDRTEAYRKLDDAAEFLMRHEPHSPTPYLVKRAVSWGNLTLKELLQELLEDNADLRTVYKLLGIREYSSLE